MKTKILLFALAVAAAVTNQARAAESLPEPAEIQYDHVPGFAQKENERSREWPSEAMVAGRGGAQPGLRFKWLGTAGFEFSDGDTTILVDPFVSRPGILGSSQRLSVRTEVVDRYILDDIDLSKLKAILVAHEHYDHVLDVPYIVASYGFQGRLDQVPALVGSPNLSELFLAYQRPYPDWKKMWQQRPHTDDWKRARYLDIEWARDPRGFQALLRGYESSLKYAIPADQETQSRGQIRRVGDWGRFRVWAVPGTHPEYDEKIVGKLAHNKGSIRGMKEKAPLVGASGYKAYENASFTFVIEYFDGRQRPFRIVCSEGPAFGHARRLKEQFGEIDILMQGVSSRARHLENLESIIRTIEPRILIPTHYDNFFKSFHKLKNLEFPLPKQKKIFGIDLDFSKFREFLSWSDEKFGREISIELRLPRALLYYGLERELERLGPRDSLVE